MTNKDDVIAKMRALKAKIGNDASTEAEVESAARMFAKLSVQHDIDESEVKDLDPEKGVIAYWQFAGSIVPPVFNAVHGALTEFTETKCWVHSNGTKRKIGFAGRGADVEMAIYLCSIIEAASRRGWFRYSAPIMGAGVKVLNEKRKGFILGFGHGVAIRFHEVLKEKTKMRTEAMGEAKGTALVVTKNRLADEAMEEIGLKLSKAKSTKSKVKVDSDAFYNGVGAAQSLTFNKTVGERA